MSGKQPPARANPPPAPVRRQPPIEAATNERREQAVIRPEKR